jgi:hypothetical protein
MKIDFHSHAFPSAVLRALNKYYPDVVQLTNGSDGKLYGESRRCAPASMGLGSCS